MPSQWIYRRFVNWVERSFLRTLVAVWFAALALLLLAYLLGPPGDTWLKRVASVAVLAVMIAWLAVSGAAMLFKLAALKGRVRTGSSSLARLYYLACCVTAAVFLVGAIVIAWIVVRSLVAT